MNTRHAFLRATGLALAIAAAYPAHADTTVSVQGNTRHYVYYRDHDIYYAPETRTYYWTADGAWHWGDMLPERWRGDVGRGGVEITLDTDRPYERHDYVVSHYKNGRGPDDRSTSERSLNRDGSVTTTTTTTSVTPRRYLYYRDQNVYYARESNTYFWRRNGNWESGHTLPSDWRLRDDHAIEVELDTDRPYEREAYVTEHYLNNPGNTVTSTQHTVGRDGSTRTTTTTTRRSYVYYGDHQIYFSPETRTYYWQDHGKWRSGSRLPYNLRPYAKNGVNIQLDTDRPYERHDYVIARYKDGVYLDDRRDRDDD